MNKHFSVRAMGLLTLLGVCTGWVVTSAWALDPALNKDILKLADTIKKGQNAVARADAAKLAKANDLDDMMDAYKPRSKGGVGIGRVAGKVLPDGIELMLQNLEKNPPGKALLDQTKELDEMANVIAAVVEIARDKPNAKGKKILKEWVGWTQEVKENAAELAKAVQNKNAKRISELAGKINATCSACHMATK